MINLVNNTAVDIRPFEKAICDAIKKGVELDEAIADIFKLRQINENKYAVEWA